MYIVPQRAPAARAAATPRRALPPGAWADEATASSVGPVNSRTAPPSTPSQRADPASRSSLKSSVPQRMPSRLLAFHSGNAMESPMSLIAKIVSVFATAHKQPARAAQTMRWGACRTSSRTAAVPRTRAGRLQRARNTPSTIMKEITTGGMPSVTSLVGASAAPSHAYAANPERVPTRCSRRSRAGSSSVRRFTAARAGPRGAPRPGSRNGCRRAARANGRVAVARGEQGRCTSPRLAGASRRDERSGLRRNRLRVILRKHGIERRERRAVDPGPRRYHGLEVPAAGDVGGLHRRGGRQVAILERVDLANGLLVHTHERRRRPGAASEEATSPASPALRVAAYLGERRVESPRRRDHRGGQR